MNGEIYHIFDKVFKKILTLSSISVINLINGLSKKFTSFISTWDKLSDRVRQLDEERTKLDKSVRTISEQFQKIENVQGLELENKDE